VFVHVLSAWSMKLHPEVTQYIYTLEYSHTIEFIFTDQLQNNVTILRCRTADYSQLAEGILAPVGDQVVAESLVAARVVHCKE